MEDIRPRQTGFAQRVRHAFRERQIYLRSDGRVQFITLRPWVQVVFAVALTAGLFWFSFATVNITFKDQIIAAKERRALQMQIAYEDRLAALQTVVDKINDRLMLDQNAYMAKLDDLRSIQKDLEDRHKLLSMVVKRGWTPPKPKSPPSLGDLSSLDGNAPQADHDRLQAYATTADGDEEAAPPPREAAAARSAAPKPRAEWKAPDHPFRTRTEAARPVVDLRDRLAALNKDQDSLLDRIENDRQAQIEKISGTLAKLGLSPKRIVPAASKQPDATLLNAGGPFVSLRSVWPQDEETRKQIVRIEKHVRRIEKLRRAVRQMPIGRPLDARHRVTSGYGVRRDPLRKSLAVHYGVDFKGSTGDVVTVAANGRVVHAGTRAGYGNLVEVRHDNGISTRYAHLSRIDVKVGDRVARHAPIGRIGSTGRSTGPHLHYEILVFGKPVDPRRFWRAGENVLKTQIQ